MIEHIRVIEITGNTTKCREVIEDSGDEWREDLTHEQHVRREMALEHKLRALGMPTRRWALEVFNEAEEKWHIASHMEAVERPTTLKIKGERPFEAQGYVFDSVYTSKQHRGKGYATVMLKEVVDQLANSLQDSFNDSSASGTSDSGNENLEVQSFSRNRHRSSEPDLRSWTMSLITLWSDVGNYYERFGFAPATRSRVISSETDEITDPEQLEWPDKELCKQLDTYESQAAIDFHRAMMVSAIDVMTEKDGHPRAIVTPTAGILDQMQWRTEYVGKCLGKNTPDIYGARTANGWAAWNYLIPEKTLYILVMTGPIYEMVLMYQAALAAAAEAGGFKVILYEADLIFPDGSLAQYLLDSLKEAGVVFSVNEPDLSIPFYLKSGARSDLRWEFAGRYSWF